MAERSRKTQDITPDTLCLFKADDGDGDLEDFDLGGAFAVGIGNEEDFAETILENTASGGRQIKFWPWVNQVQCPIPILRYAFTDTIALRLR